MPQSILACGNLGADAEVRYTPTGKQVTTLRLAVNETYTDKAGERKEHTEWFNAQVWGEKSAEVLKAYAKKGSLMWLSGKNRTRKNGEGESARYYTTLVVDEYRFLGPRKEAQPEEGRADGAPDGSPESEPLGEPVGSF